MFDGALSHRSRELAHPENVDFPHLPAYSLELDPAERRFQEFRSALSKGSLGPNRIFETVEPLQGALTQALEPYLRIPAQLQDSSVPPGGRGRRAIEIPMPYTGIVRFSDCKSSLRKYRPGIRQTGAVRQAPAVNSSNGAMSME